MLCGLFLEDAIGMFPDLSSIGVQRMQGVTHMSTGRGAEIWLFSGEGTYVWVGFVLSNMIVLSVCVFEDVSGSMGSS